MSVERDQLARRLRRDAATALFVLALAGGLAATIFGGSGRLHRDYGVDPGPALVPELLLMVLAGLGAVLLAVTAVDCLRHRTISWAVPSPKGGADLIYPLALLASLAIYVAVLRQVGFIASSAILSILWCALLLVQVKRQLSRRDAATAVFFGLAIVTLIYAVFRHLLRVPLP